MMIRRLSLCVSLLALALVAIPTQAFGAADHPFLQVFDSGFEDACGIAFNPGYSRLYISDYHRDAIDSSGQGTLVTEIANEDPGDGPCKLAFDSSGDLYVNNWHQDIVKYTEPFSVGTVIDSNLPTGLAVDPATNNVYVAHRTYVSEYGPTGTLIREIGVGSLEGAYGVAVSDFPATAGYVYVPDAASNTVKVFDPATSLSVPVEVMNGAATPQDGFKHLVDSEVAVDQSSGHIYILDDVGYGLSEQPEAVFDEFNAAGAYRGQITGFTDAEPSGIEIQESGGQVIYVTSGNSEESKIFLYGPTAPAHTLKVAKSGTGGGSITSLPNGINCGSACTAEYNEEELVTLSAAPDAHSIFTGWTVTGPGSEPCGGGEGSTCSVLLSANIEVTANFEEPTQQTLEVSVTGSGSVTSSPAGLTCSSGTCSEHFNEGRLVTLTATPAAHNRFSRWTGCDSEPSPTQCRVTMSAAKAVSAEFAAASQKVLTVTKTGSGEGLVKSSPAGISCPGSCSAGFDEGSTVALTATPAPGSAFVGFSGGGCSGTGVCEVAMSQAQSVSAEFATAFGAAAAKSSFAPPPAAALALTVKGTALTATVSGAGTLSAEGKGLRATQVHAVGAGSVTLRLALSGPGKRHLARARHHRLALKVDVGFVPSSGVDAAASGTVTFWAPHRPSKTPQR